GVHGNELWKTDGTTDGTALVADINQWPGGIQGRILAASGSRILFRTDIPGSQNPLLWVTDGTEAGTSPVTYLHPSGPDEYDGDREAIAAPQGGFLFADDHGDGQELWYTDGTSNGTVKISNAGSPHEMVSFQGAVYFAAADSSGGVELWRSDGTAAGTARLKDVLPG